VTTRTNQLLQFTGPLALALALGTLLLGQARPKSTPKVIQAKAFEVVDEKGQVLARLGSCEQKQGRAVALDLICGEQSVKLTAGPTTTGLLLIEAGQERVNLVSDRNSGGLDIRDRNGTIRALLGLNHPSKTTSLLLLDGSGAVIARVP
jgi:hypothetical protein